ncbi:ABC transporter ATP-binding protein, partial [Chloroflexota bacterium]
VEAVENAHQRGFSRAVLIPQEVDQLFETLQRLQADGLSVVFISHKLEEVMHISGGVTVLRDGKVMGTVNTADTTQRELARMMVGRETFGVRREGTDEIGDPVLRLEGLSALDDRELPALREVSLTVCAGEILGIAGVSGNGQKELSETVCGVRPPSGGHIFVGNEDVTAAGPQELDAAGVGRIPQDRHAGVIGELTVAENVALQRLGEFTKGGIIDRQAVSEYAQGLIEQFQIKASLGDRARTLSGGNLQKLILARVLSREPKVVIAPQPTRGLDVGATEYVRTQLLEQRTRGAAVMLISEDLEEILALSDRIAVMYEGEIVGIVPTRDADEEHLGLMMSGSLKERPDVAAET